MKTFSIALGVVFGLTVLLAGLGIVGTPTAVAAYLVLIAFGGVAVVYMGDGSVATAAHEPAE